MSLFTDEQFEKLYMNGLSHRADHIPVAYLVHLELKYQWLITEISKNNPNIAYGLFYINKEKPKVGEIDLSFIDQLNNVDNGVFNYPAFQPVDTLAVYKGVAEERGFIVAMEEYSGALFEKYRKLIY